MLVRKKGFTSKHKIADKWETEPYEIVSQRSDGLPVFTVMHNDREKTLHRNMLFPLGIRRDIDCISADNIDSELLRDPVAEQVNESQSEGGEVDQSIYEGPQTRSRTRKLAKANLLLDDLFDISTGEVCDDITDITDLGDEHPICNESIKELILQFWFYQVQTIYDFYCDLVDAGTHSINC